MVILRENGPEGLKRLVENYLQYGTNLQKWLFFRLNSGDFIVVQGKSRRRIKGMPKGTADFVVFRRIPKKKACRTIFLETKSVHGHQTSEQREFEHEATEQGAEYYLIQDFAEVERLLPYEVAAGRLPALADGVVTNKPYRYQREGER